MGLIEEELSELRKLTKKVLDGEIDPRKAAGLLSIYEETYKRERLLYDFIKLSSQSHTWKKATSKNLIGKNTAIPTLSESVDLILCPEQGDVCITYDQCLEYSGKEEHYSDCKDCPNFSASRKRILND